MSATATLVYTIKTTPPLTETRLQAAVAAIALPTGDMANFGATLISDNTTEVDASTVQRTIVFDISSPAFEENFPSATNQQASPFVNLYTPALAGKLGMTVVASPPAIA